MVHRAVVLHLLCVACDARRRRSRARVVAQKAVPVWSAKSRLDTYTHHSYSKRVDVSDWSSTRPELTATRDKPLDARSVRKDFLSADRDPIDSGAWQGQSEFYAAEADLASSIQRPDGPRASPVSRATRSAGFVKIAAKPVRSNAKENDGTPVKTHLIADRNRLTLEQFLNQMQANETNYTFSDADDEDDIYNPGGYEIRKSVYVLRPQRAVSRKPRLNNRRLRNSARRERERASFNSVPRRSRRRRRRPDAATRHHRDVKQRDKSQLYRKAYVRLPGKPNIQMAPFARNLRFDQNNWQAHHSQQRYSNEPSNRQRQYYANRTPMASAKTANSPTESHPPMWVRFNNRVRHLNALADNLRNQFDHHNPHNVYTEQKNIELVYGANTLIREQRPLFSQINFPTDEHISDLHVGSISLNRQTNNGDPQRTSSQKMTTTSLGFRIDRIDDNGYSSKIVNPYNIPLHIGRHTSRPSYRHNDRPMYAPTGLYRMRPRYSEEGYRL